MGSNTIFIKYLTNSADFTQFNGFLTLTVGETETQTETDDKYTELNGNLCCHLSLCNVYIPSHNPIQPIFIGLGHCQCDETIIRGNHNLGKTRLRGLCGGGTCLLALTTRGGLCNCDRLHYLHSPSAYAQLMAYR